MNPPQTAVRASPFAGGGVVPALRLGRRQEGASRRLREGQRGRDALGATLPRHQCHHGWVLVPGRGCPRRSPCTPWDHADVPRHVPSPAGILKDYLRELPTPLITPTLYHVVLEAMAKRPPRITSGERDAVTLLDCLPDVEKVSAQS